jgi:biotin carboxyl carrier protein
VSQKIISIDGTDSEFTLKPNVRSLRIADGREVELISVSGNDAVVSIGGVRENVPFLISGEEVHFVLRGETYRAAVSEKLAGKKGRHRDHSLSAPMPGVVLKLFVEVGAEVAKGAPLLILEAMKMEHQISAPFDGVVEKISCQAGELVQPGIDLISVRPKEEE